jgi:hypothetical protein
VLPASFLEAFNFLPTCAALQSVCPTLSHYLYDVLLLLLGGAPAGSGHLELERPDRVAVFFTDILFYIFPENYNGVVILLHLAQGALYARLEPLRDALGVKHVFALELLVRSLGLLKTDGTCL